MLGERRVLIAAAAAAFALAGCGESGESKGERTVTVYSSLPLQGGLRANAVDALRGMRMALAERDGRAGGARVRLVSLDDSLASTGTWDAGRVSANARRAVRDADAIAYVGEANSGATAVSLPITNEAGMLQLSPGSTYGGLTRPGDFAPGEPGKHYPSRRRTFARVIPADHVQARAVVAYLRHEGVRRVHLLHDRDAYGRGLVAEIAKALPGSIERTGTDGIDVRAANFRGLAHRVRGADAVFFGGTATQAAQLAKDLLAASPRMLFFSPDATGDPSFFGEVGRLREARLRLTLPVLPPDALPASGRAFLERFEKKHGAAPQPFAIYGYETMALLLEAIERADAVNRDAIVDSVFATRDRRSVLGTYSVDRNGDTTAAFYGGYRVRGGQLAFDRVLPD